MQLYANFEAFNRWLEDDWGYAFADRIFAAPLLSLRNVDLAVAELDRLLTLGARVISLRPGPAFGHSPADPMFDPFWARANESGITVLFHGGETRYTQYLTDWGESGNTESFRITSFRSLSSANPLQDTMASMLALGLFARFGRLRIGSIENGSDWVFHLFEKLTKAFGQTPFLFPEDPRETFRRHIWISPFYEDQLASLRDLVGVDRIVMGSDYPHVEGLAEPASYIKDLENFGYTPDQCEKVMFANGVGLSRRLG